MKMRRAAAALCFVCLAATAAAQPSPIVPRLSRLPGAGELRAAYWSALALLGRQQPEAARDAVVALETQASDAGVEAEALLQAQLDVARRLGEISPACLPAIVALQAEVYVDHSNAGRFQLAAHAAALAARIALAYPEIEPTPESRAGAAQGLAHLARVELLWNDLSRARLALDQALDLSPNGQPALLLAAALEEKSGRYDTAVERLSTVLAATVGHAEALVRRAVCLRRLSRPADAERDLQAVLAAAGDPWLRELAWQERVRLALDAEQWRAAEEIARAGLDDFPGSAGLALQLAYALDRGGDPRKAQAIAERVIDAAPADRETVRHRYSSWPDLGPGAAGRVSAAAWPQLRALTAAIEGSMAPQGE